MLEGTFSTTDDLADDAFDLVATTLPKNLAALDLISAAGVQASGLPVTYPLDADGNFISHSQCQTVAIQAHSEDLDGVEAHAAVRASNGYSEFAWWPRNAEARPYGDRLPYGLWRSALLINAGGLFESRS
jgi:hypothetical protein